jgi:hypothetical protein
MEPEVHYSVHKRPKRVLFFGQMNPVTLSHFTFQEQLVYNPSIYA